MATMNANCWINKRKEKYCNDWCCWNELLIHVEITRRNFSFSHSTFYIQTAVEALHECQENSHLNSHKIYCYSSLYSMLTYNFISIFPRQSPPPLGLIVCFSPPLKLLFITGLARKHKNINLMNMCCWLQVCEKKGKVTLLLDPLNIHFTGFELCIKVGKRENMLSFSTLGGNPAIISPFGWACSNFLWLCSRAYMSNLKMEW